MRQNEKVICEAINTYLNDDAQLGLHKGTKETSFKDVPRTSDNKNLDHTLQFMHEQINDLFDSKVADLTHYESICTSFHRVHNYKYITDPSFASTLDKELSAQGIPKDQRLKVEKVIPKVIKELCSDANEQDFGYHPELDDIMNTSRKANDTK